MTLIQKFAKAHKLKVVPDDDSIRFSRGGVELAVIFDIEEEYRSDGHRFVSSRVQKSFIAKARKNNLLGLLLFAEREGQLYNAMHFEVPAYDHYGDSGEPDVFCKNSAWYEMLKALGFEHDDGDDDGICFTFPALCPKAAKIALMLAGDRSHLV